MGMRMRTPAIVAATLIALGLLTTGTANAKDGNPAGETLEHCRTAPPGPCVDTKGWGVRVKTAKGTWTKNYGPESYRYTRSDGRLFYTFTTDAVPYGKAKFPRDIDY